MSNSNLVSYVRLVPHFNPRQDKIAGITIHHMAGNLTLETVGNVFANRKVSANYAVSSSGKIGMYVEEHNRSWATSNPKNDHKMINIEVANDGVAPDWHVSDIAIEKTIELCVDICKRNSITSLNYTGDAKGNLTRHNMFKATTCPGAYLQSKFPYIADQVNKRLAPVESRPMPEVKTLDYIAKEVIAGLWGNGVDRQRNLEVAGYDYSDIQARVNNILGVKSPSGKKSNTEIAKEVIAGKWGNGQSRRSKLVAAG